MKMLIKSIVVTRVTFNLIQATGGGEIQRATTARRLPNHSLFGLSALPSSGIKTVIKWNSSQ